LKRREASFFEILVLFNQAKSPSEKSRFWQKMQKFKAYRDAHLLQDDQMAYYSHWYIVAIRELIQTPKFRNDPQWIGDVLTPNITARQAEQALEVLERLGLIKKSGDGKIISTDKMVATTHEVQSLAVAQFHTEMMDRAKEALEKIPSSLRDLTSVTLAVEESKVEAMKTRISEMRKELLARFDAEGNKRERVFQMNFHLFPLSKNLSGEESEDLDS